MAVIKSTKRIWTLYLFSIYSTNLEAVAATAAENPGHWIATFGWLATKSFLASHEWVISLGSF